MSKPDETVRVPRDLLDQLATDADAAADAESAVGDAIRLWLALTNPDELLADDRGDENTTRYLYDDV